MLKCYSDLNFIDQQIGFDVYIVGIQSKRLYYKIAKFNRDYSNN